MQRYNGKHDDYILELFEISEGNATKASEIYLKEKGNPIHYKTILKRWRKKGFIDSRRYNGKHDDYILELFERTKVDKKKFKRDVGNATKASRIYRRNKGKSIDPKTISKRWRDAELTELHSHGGYRWGISKERFQEIHKEFDGDGKKIIESTGMSRRKYVRKCYECDLPIKNVSTHFPPKKRETAGLEGVI